MKILVVEDEQSLSDSIKTYLSKEGYICEVAGNYNSSHFKINLYQYDCVIVDINLPDGSGLDLIKELKGKDSEIGIIIISARNSLDDKIKGLEIGSDDYITKPFHLSELNARIKALIRRKRFNGHKEMNINEIRVIPDERQVWINNIILPLTRKEYDLFFYLITNKNRVVTKESIAEYLWGDDMDMADSFDFVYAHVKNLRRKMKAKGGNDYIETMYGIGYKFSLH